MVTPIFDHADNDFELPHRDERKGKLELLFPQFLSYIIYYHDTEKVVNLSLEPINMKYKERIKMQHNSNAQRKIKDVNLSKP